MRPGKDLIGKPIYSVDKGKLLGTVKDLFIDLDLNLVNGVYLGSEGLFSRKINAILREDIVAFGLDAVLTTASDSVVDSGELAMLDTWLRREMLQGRGVDTPGGTKVGTVGDVLLDPNAKIVGYSLSKVRVAGPVAEHRQVLNDAVIENGGKEGTMIVDLSKAEQPGSSPPTETATDEEPSVSEAVESPDSDSNEDA